MIRVVAATPTSAWISRLSRSSRNDWSTLRPNHERILKSWAVLARPFLSRSSNPGMLFLSFNHGPEADPDVSAVLIETWIAEFRLRS